MTTLIILYLLTGWIMSFDYFYLEKEKHKHHSLIESGIIMMLFILLWMPVSLVAIYWYALIALYNIITEEEDD
ncbi:MAG: hypothetical protein K5656_01795 [Lachnospiraceae bacterium]|nr:hypothetical protein [Lachnospiraceae bacterium]